MIYGQRKYGITEEIFRQNPKKDIMQLKRKRKKLRKQYQNTKNVYEKTLIIERIKLIKEHIIYKMKENGSRRIIKVAKQIKQFHTIKYEKKTESNVHPRF